MLHRCAVSLCVLGVLSFGVSVASATTYTLTDIGTLGGTTSAAYAVNDSGWVTGWANGTSATVPRAFLATPTGSGGAYVMIDVSSFAGFATTVTTWALGINDSGAVIGNSMGPSNRNGFIYTGGPNGGSANVTYLSSLSGPFRQWRTVIHTASTPPGRSPAGLETSRSFPTVQRGGAGQSLRSSLYPTAYAINDNGRIVGNRSGMLTDPTNHPFYSDNGGTMQPMFSDDPAAEAFGINNAGTVVGEIGGGNQSGPNNVARPGANSTLVGSCRDLGNAYVATWNGSSLHAGPFCPRCPWVAADGAFGISTAGAVVGQVKLPKAYIATLQRQRLDHNRLEYVGDQSGGRGPATVPNAISQNGNYIVGFGTTSSGGPTPTVLLTAVPTPEPLTLLLAAAGLIGSAGLRPAEGPASKYQEEQQRVSLPTNCCDRGVCRWDGGLPFAPAARGRWSDV